MAHSATLCGHLVFVNGGGYVITCFSYAQNGLVFNTKTTHWKTLNVAIKLKDHSTPFDHFLGGDNLLIIGGKMTLQTWSTKSW